MHAQYVHDLLKPEENTKSHALFWESSLLPMKGSQELGQQDETVEAMVPLVPTSRVSSVRALAAVSG